MGHSHLRISLPGQRESQPKVSGGSGNSYRSEDQQQEEKVLPESVFHSMLTQERRRAERSRKPFLLMLLDANAENGAAEGILKQAVNIVVASKRETDLVGWYRLNAILGIIFTEVSLEGDLPITDKLRTKIETAFVKHLGQERATKIAVSLHIFPESLDKTSSDWVADSKLYSELKRKNSRKRVRLSSGAS